MFHKNCDIQGLDRVKDVWEGEGGGGADILKVAVHFWLFYIPKKTAEIFFLLVPPRQVWNDRRTYLQGYQLMQTPD